MGVNKVVYAGNTIIDISDSTVTSETLSKGTTAYGANGEILVGSMTSNGKSEVVRYAKPTSVPIESGMQIIFYAAGAGTMSFTMGSETYSHYLKDSSTAGWMLWIQTGDVDGSFIFPGGTRRYMYMGGVATEATISFTPDNSNKPDMAYIVITA